MAKTQSQAMSDKITLTADQMRGALHACVVARRGAIVLGSPGGGKTSLVRGMAAEVQAAFISSPPLPTLDPTDLRGIPRVDLVKLRGSDASIPRTVWSVPDFLPVEPPESPSGLGIVLYDDFTTAPPAVQAPFYQLWLEGHLGAYQMPAGYVQFATGNYDTDRAGTHRSLTPMRSRWITLHLGSDVETFSRGAVSGWQTREPVRLPDIDVPRPRPIRPEVLGFLRFRPELLNQFTPDALSYPCERSWEIASDVFYATEAIGGVDPTVEHALIAGTVGVGTSAEVLGFLRHYRSLPSLDEILARPEKAIVPKEPAALYAVSALLGRKADGKNFGVLRRYLDRLPKEFQVFMVRDALRRDNAIADNPKPISKTPEFVKWAAVNQTLVVI